MHGTSVKIKKNAYIGGSIPALQVYIQLEFFHLPTLMHNSLFINNMYVTLLSSTCFEH